MYRYKKVFIICCILCCCIVMFLLTRKQYFYIHSDVPEIEEIHISKVFSVPSMEQKDEIENIILNDTEKINDIISKLKTYHFRKIISFGTTTEVPLTTENITTFFIGIYYKGEELEHFDRILFDCTEDKKIRRVQIYCYTADTVKEYTGKVSHEVMEQFLEDMGVYFQ